MERNKKQKNSEERHHFPESEKIALKATQAKIRIKHHFVVPWEIVDNDDTINNTTK